MRTQKLDSERTRLENKYLDKTSQHDKPDNKCYFFYFQLKLYAAQLAHNPRIDNTYKAKAFFNLTNDVSYGGVTFDADHPYMLFCFQFLFPLVVIILSMMYSHWWLIKKCRQDNQEDDWAVDPDSWAIPIAHAIISSTLIVYILTLDIAALKFREYAPEYYNESYNALLFHYPGTVLFWDILAVVITILIGASLSEPHTSESNGAIFIYYYYYYYYYICVVRRSVNGN